VLREVALASRARQLHSKSTHRDVLNKLLRRKRLLT